jgi:putative DNA primase/helicase
LPASHELRAHTSCEYWHDQQRIGSYAALLAPVRDVAGDLVTLHATYLEHGRKLTEYEPRKILSRMTGRTGCAVQLLPLFGDTLGIAEGIETALAAAQLHHLPVWSALNTSLLAKYEPLTAVRNLIVFADRDAPGLEAAARLMERLQGRVRVELRLPPAPAKDFADALAISAGGRQP